MEQLKKILKNLPKPKPEVSQFRADLRRRVLNTPLPADTPTFRVHLLWAAACVTCVATVLVLFVAMPEIPTQMHARITGQPVSLENSPITATSPTSETDLWDWPTVDADQALVEQFVQYQYGHTDPIVQPVDTGEIFAVRKFRLANGRQILVYTALPERQDPRPMGF